MFLITARENNLESRKCILFKCVLVAFIVFFSCIIMFNGCSTVKAAEQSEYTTLSASDMYDYISSRFYVNSEELESYITQYYNEYQYYYVIYSDVAEDSYFSIWFCNNPSNTFCNMQPMYLADQTTRTSDWTLNSSEYDLNYISPWTAPYLTTNSSSSATSSFDCHQILLRSDNSLGLYHRYNYYRHQWWTDCYFSLNGTTLYLNDCTSQLIEQYSCNTSLDVFGCLHSDLKCISNYNGDYYNITADISGPNNSSWFYTWLNRYRVPIVHENLPIYYSSDDRLKITSINDSYGNKDLVLDFTDFGTSTSAATYTYSDLTLTYTIDDIEYTLTDIDSYIEQIGDVQGLIDIMAFIPYSSFQSFTEYNNVILTGVTFTRTISSAGGSGSENFYISTNYYINKSTSESGMEDIEYSEDVSGDKLSSDTISSKQYLIDFNQGYGLSYTEFQSLDKPDFFEDDAYYVYLSNDGTLSELLDILGSIQDIQAIVSFIDNIDNEIQLQESMESYLYNNAYTQTCSMIVFVYIENWTDFTAGTISSDDLSYYYYVTTYGRLKQVNQQVADLYIETNQIAVNTKETYNYLKLRLDDFEDKSLNKLDNIISNGSNSLSWLHTIDFDINSGFNSVVNAINNISIPEQDNTDIIDKLSYVISAIDNIVVPDVENELDTPQECIEYYRANIDTSIEDIPLQYRVAYFEGMTLDKLYTYGINSDSSTLLASTSDSDYSDDSIFVIKYFYDTILDVMNNSTMYNNLVNGMNDIGDSSTYFYDMFDTDFDITSYYGFS